MTSENAVLAIHVNALPVSASPHIANGFEAAARLTVMVPVNGFDPAHAMTTVLSRDAAFLRAVPRAYTTRKVSAAWLGGIAGERPPRPGDLVFVRVETRLPARAPVAIRG